MATTKMIAESDKGPTLLAIGVAMLIDAACPFRKLYPDVLVI